MSKQQAIFVHQSKIKRRKNPMKTTSTVAMWFAALCFLFAWSSPGHATQPRTPITVEIDISNAPALNEQATATNLSIANRQAEIMMRIASEFGFTPASRSRLSAPSVKAPSLFDGLGDPQDGAI